MSLGYKFEAPGCGVTFEVERLRRERHDLMGELRVKCDLPGARSINGYISIAEYNFSSPRAQQDRAKLLKERANTNGQLDWFALLEEFRHRVFDAEREGQPAIDLRELSRPVRGDEIKIEGLVFPKRHPSILFGDGGAAKSYTALYVAGQLAQRGLNVALFDWELCGEDHRDRLERLFGRDMPLIRYCRCEHPLTFESDRLGRVVREQKIDYAIYDSIAFACDGPPESAEIAGKYFRAVREIDCGSLHIAHVNRSETNDQKPFGSTFWHNGARSTWFVQAIESAGNNTNLRLGFFNRKANLGPLCPAVSLTINFGAERTEFIRGEIADVPELAEKLSIRQRMLHLLKRGARTPEEIAEELGEQPESVKKAIRRDRRDKQQQFTVIEGGRVGLRDQSA
jgi:hypothetical protein